MSNITFWGLIASPYQLKMQALADHARLPWQRFPDQAGTAAAVSMFLKLRRARRLERVQRYPAYLPGVDEYPAVPYYTFDGKQFYYDSTGLALHIESMRLSTQSPLPGDPAARFICQLIDEAFDEFGLYMVHHQRWVTSASTNVMGAMTVREMRRLLPSFTRNTVADRLARRQVRRCPYLFSTAPEGFECGLPTGLTPPSRPGFPPTHELLDTAWRRYLTAMEQILSRQPYLLGERFTLADASASGQLGMNLVDGRAADLLLDLAPLTFQWLGMIRDGAHRNSTGEPVVTDALAPLLQCIVDTFIPLMRQNAAAYENALARGQRVFNEAAFDRGEALYDGTLLGLPFRSVAKSFQVVTWHALCEQWQALADRDRQQLTGQFPLLEDGLFTRQSARQGPGADPRQAASD